MASRPVLGTAAIRNTPSVMSAPPELVLGDKVLGTAYDVVKEVLLHLQKIEELNSAIDNVHHLIPLLDQITLTGVKGAGGGGLLADNPEIHLDTSSLPIHDGEIIPADDRMVLHSGSAGEDRTVSVEQVKAKITAALTALTGVSYDSSHLGSFIGSAVPENLTIKQAIQALASFTESGFASRDAAVTQTVSDAVNDAIVNVRDTITWLEASVIDLGSTTDGLATENDDLQTALTGLTTVSTNLSNSLTALQTTVANQGNVLTLISSDVLEKASGWLVDLLNSRVDDAEGGLTDQMLLIDYLTLAMEDKADHSSLLDLIDTLAEAEGAWDAAKEALAALEAELVVLRGEVTSFLGSQGSTAFRDLEARLRNLSTHAMFEGALAFTQRREIIAQQDTDRASFLEEIQVLVAADAALATRTTSLEATTASTSASIDTLETAYAAADEALSSRIDTLEVSNGALTASLDTLEAAYVDADEALAAQITTLNSSLAGKASATALDALSTTVTEVDGKVTSTAEALTEVMAGEVAGDTASVRVRMAAQTAPSGVSARYGIEVKGVVSGVFQAAGFYMDVLSGGGSRVAISTDKFFIYNGTTIRAPFMISGSTVYMQNVMMDAAYISGALTASQINVSSLSALSGNLGTITVDTLNIAGNAVTIQAGMETAGGVSIGTSFNQMQSVTVTWGTSASVYVFCQFKASLGDQLEIDIRSGGSSLPGFPKTFSPKNDGFSQYFDLFQSGVVSGAGVTFWLRRTSAGTTTINARKLIVFAAKR